MNALPSAPAVHRDPKGLMALACASGGAIVRRLCSSVQGRWLRLNGTGRTTRQRPGFSRSFTGRPRILFLRRCANTTNSGLAATARQPPVPPTSTCARSACSTATTGPWNCARSPKRSPCSAPPWHKSGLRRGSRSAAGRTEPRPGAGCMRTVTACVPGRTIPGSPGCFRWWAASAAVPPAQARPSPSRRRTAGPRRGCGGCTAGG